MAAARPFWLHRPRRSAMMVAVPSRPAKPPRGDDRLGDDRQTGLTMHAAATSPTPGLVQRYRFLAYAAAPVAVLVGALLVFETSAPADADFTATIHQHIAVQQPAGLPHNFAEHRARYIWFAGAFLDLVIAGYAVGFCGWFLVRHHDSARLRGVLVVGAALGVLGFAYLGLATLTENTLFRVVYALPFRALEFHQLAGNPLGPSLLSAVNGILVAINLLAVIAPLAAVLATCSVTAAAAPGHDLDLPALSRRVRSLNDVLSVGSALLVAGILHMSVWLHWTAALLSDEELRKGMEGLALAITTFWGATFSLMIVTAYVPTATRLHGLALAWIESHPQADADSPKKSLEKHDLDTAPARRLPQFAMMLAPLVASPISALLAGMSGK